MSKSWIAFLAGMLLWPGALAAQVTLSVYGGGARTALSGDGPRDTRYQARIGPVVGVTADFYVTSDVAISIQPSYSQRGTGIAFRDVAADEYRDSVDIRMNYVSVPVLLKVFAVHQRTFVTGGLDFGYLLSATRDDGGGAVDVDNVFKNYDVSVVFGFGVAILKRRPELTVELRYIQSVVNVANPAPPSQGAESLPVRFRLAGLQLLAAVGFTLGSGND